MVYSNSACNIAASASDDPDGGLFRSREPEDVNYGYIDIDFPSGASRDFDIWDQHYMDRLTRGPLTGRGWVFQERVLSPRVLHFTRSQVVWECFQMNKCEMFPIQAPTPSEANFVRELKMVYPFSSSGSWAYFAKEEPDKTMSVDAYEQWSHLVKEYSKCALTYRDDRLIAMSGIAEMYKKYTGDEYLAGLWRSRLVEGLNWLVTDPVAQPQNKFRVPSWSWAAVDSAVLLTRVNMPRDDDLVEILSAVAETPTTTAGWRHVQGSITLRGCLSKATVRECGVRSQTAENVIVKLEDFPSRLFAYPDTTNTTFDEGATLYLLPLRSTLRREIIEDGDKMEKLLGKFVVIIEGIIMELVSETDASYQRVGHFVVRSTDHAGFLGLLATPPWPDARCDKVSMDYTKTSVITLL